MMITPHHINLYNNLNLGSLRRMFYLVSPNETSFETVEQVPNYFDLAGSWFVVFIISEYIFIRLYGHDYQAPINDSLTSMISGSFSMMFKLLSRSFGMNMYIYIYQNYRLIDLDWKSNSTWYLCFMTEDLAYYLWHRALHEFGFFWAFHQIHHSSQYYNLSTAMRQGVFQEFAATLFELFQAIAIPPQVYLVHRYLLLLNQIWVHTEWIPKLGPLEWFMNTPSHHRVHHGRNAYCLDKNYGGTLIIWDRMFGTFEEERDDEPVAYGLVKQYYTFNQFYLQFNVFKEMLFDKPWYGLDESASLLDRLKCYVLPVGWFPGAKLKWFLWWRLEDTEADVPEIENPIVYYNPVLPDWFTCYVYFTYIVLANTYQNFLNCLETYSTAYAAVYCGYLVFTMLMFGYLLEPKPWIGKLECARLLAAAIFTTFATNAPVFTTVCYLQFFFWMFYYANGGGPLKALNADQVKTIKSD